MVDGMKVLTVPSSQQDLARARRELEMERVLERTSLEKFSWRRAGFGSVMIANFTIENRNDFAVRDIVVRCSFDAASGTQIGQTRETIYQRFPARKRTAVKDFSFGFIPAQTERAGCRVNRHRF